MSIVLWVAQLKMILLPVGILQYPQRRGLSLEGPLASHRRPQSSQLGDKVQAERIRLPDTNISKMHISLDLQLRVFSWNLEGAAANTPL
jgi:hypothetical protein